MSVVLLGSTSGSVTLQEPAVAGSTTINLPATSGTMAVLPTATSVLPEASGGTGTTTGYYGFKSRIINGAMVIDQRNAGASVTPATGSYTLDRWLAASTQASKYTVQQNAGSVTPPAGFSNYLGVTSTSAYALTGNDAFSIQQRLEGFNTADFNFGTASATNLTLSFWVQSSLTGTFGGEIFGSPTRSYPFTYSIPTANTWTYITIAIAGDTTVNTYNTTNGFSFILVFGLGASGTGTGGTVNTWQNGNFIQPAGTVSVVSTNAATWYITGVQLEKGSTATSFDYRPYGTELALCQRYFYKHQNTNGGNSYPIMLQAYSTTAAFGKICDLPVTMRTNPTSSTTATSGTFTPSAANGTAAGAFTATVIETSTVNALCTGAWTGSSGLVAGNVTTVTMPNNAFFSASAEL
jgi:hypothetical protein